jgi:hypothetical protein
MQTACRALAGVEGEKTIRKAQSINGAWFVQHRTSICSQKVTVNGPLRAFQLHISGTGGTTVL